MQIPPELLTGVIKTDTHIMSARRSGFHFYTSVDAPLELGQQFHYDHMRYKWRVLDIRNEPTFTRITAEPVPIYVTVPNPDHKPLEPYEVVQ